MRPHKVSSAASVISPPPAAYSLVLAMISFASVICHSVASIRRLDANATPFLSRAASRDKRSHVIRARQVLLPMQHSATLVKLIFWMVGIHAAYELLAQNKKVAPWPSSTESRPLSGCGSPPGLSPAIEAAMGAALKTEKRTRQRRPSAPSPRTATTFPARFAPRSQRRPNWSASSPPLKGRTSASSGLVSS